MCIDFPYAFRNVSCTHSETVGCANMVSHIPDAFMPLLIATLAAAAISVAWIPYIWNPSIPSSPPLIYTNDKERNLKMKFTECVELLSNVNETRRIASAYVEDCRRLNIDELKITLHSNPTVRIISFILIRDYLLNTDEFFSSCKETDNAVIKYEKKL